MNEFLGVEDLIEIFQKQIDVLKERAQEHGDFDMFSEIARLYGIGTSSSDVAKMLACVKMARLNNNPFNEDSLIDYLNYMAIKTIFDVNIKRINRKNEKEGR